MRKTIVVLAVAILLISSFPTIVFAAPPDNPAPVSDFSSQQILVKFKAGTSLPEVAQIHRQLGGKVKESIPGIWVQVVTVPKGQAKEKAKAYSSNARVAYAEPDFTAQALGSPDDPFFTNQWGLTKVGASQAWDVTTGSPSINVAILDTGVDLDHPDLANKIMSNMNFSGSNTTDDVYGHGTHVAGIAAAITNNRIGVAGLGYASSIINVKVLGDDGMGYWSWVAQGIIWAADNGANIINLSLGDSSTSSTVEDAINYAWNKGVVVIAAAGNNGNSNPFYPAYYPNCIAVAATDGSDMLSPWSNRGDWVDVGAPGDNILSTWKGNRYGSMSGTSMASPHVAGLAALVFTTVSDANGDGKLNDEVRSRIEANCDDIGVLGIGSGRINAARAVVSVPVLPGIISGQVTDSEDSSPIVGATVSDGTRTVLTDAAGQYSINDVPPGSYQVAAGKEGYETSSLAVSVPLGGTAEADFSLNEVIVPGNIVGTVTSAKDGSAISGAQVSDGSRTALTDALGTYTIDNVPPGSYEVVASKEGYQTSSLTVTVLAGSTTVANLCLSEIVVPGSIAGSVTDAKDGSPVVGATVSDGARTAVTDTGGQYIIGGVPEGSYTVTASAASYSASSQAVSVVAAQTTTVNFALTELTPPPPEPFWVQSIAFSLTGKNMRLNINVVSASGAVVGAQVVVQLTNGVRNWNFTGTTDSSGSASFVVTKAPAGSYVASITAITATGYTWDTTQGVTSASYTLKRGGGKR
jgi:thermitase